ncbi:MAG: LysE family translocator [Rhodospirillales bacterium]|nr:LysE family translocator [Rhodospirillales bacterium]
MLFEAGLWVKLIKAIVAGFVVAVPVGAIGAICLKRALQGLWIDGLCTGCGAALADSILAAGAMLSLTLITQYVLDHEGPLLLIGGVVLIVLGIRMIRTRHYRIEEALELAPSPTRGWRWWLGDFATGFGLTIINPATLAAFAFVFAGFGLFASETGRLLDNWVVIVGVFVGSMLWWVTLISAARAVRRHASTKAVSAVNAILGSLVLGFGVFSLVRLLAYPA